MDEQIRNPLSVEDAMRMAIKEAFQGAPFVSPNPLVGCVVLDEKGIFLKAGHHQMFGGPHAEVNALQGLTNEQLQGAHVIVTLEPCAHEGKTPSCAKFLAKLPIKKVTYGLVDPNPLVAGEGARILQAAGKEVQEFQGLKEELEEVCEAFLMNFRHKKIFVALKVASSLDGQMALKSGESKWITGEKAREQTHYLRACYDAVLVGSGTVKTDNPSLNIRHPKIQKVNKVVVLDPQAELLESYSKLNISKTHRPQDVYWCVRQETSIKEFSLRPEILKIQSQGELFNLDHLMTQLWSVGIRSVFVEGGSKTYGHLIRQNWAHRLYIFLAPHLMGAGGGLSWTEGLEILQMKDRQNFSGFRFEKVGEDLFLTARFKT